MVWQWTKTRPTPNDDWGQWVLTGCLGCSADYGDMKKGYFKSCTQVIGYSSQPCSQKCTCSDLTDCLIPQPSQLSNPKCKYYLKYVAGRSGCQWGQFTPDWEHSPGWLPQTSTTNNSINWGSGWTSSNDIQAGKIYPECPNAVVYKAFDKVPTPEEAQKAKPSPPGDSLCSPCNGGDKTKWDNKGKPFVNKDPDGRDNPDNVPCNLPDAPLQIYDIKELQTYDLYKYFCQKAPGKGGGTGYQAGDDCSAGTFDFQKKTDQSGDQHNVFQLYASDLTYYDLMMTQVTLGGTVYRMLQNIGQVISGGGQTVYFRAVKHGVTPQSPQDSGQGIDNNKNLPQEKRTASDCVPYFICYIRCVQDENKQNKVQISGDCGHWAYYGLKSKQWQQANSQHINKWQPTQVQGYDYQYVKPGQIGQTADCSQFTQPPKVKYRIAYLTIQTGSNKCPDDKDDQETGKPKYSCTTKQVQYCTGKLASGGVYTDTSFDNPAQYDAQAKCYKVDGCTIYYIYTIYIINSQNSDQNQECPQPPQNLQLPCINFNCDQKPDYYLYSPWFSYNTCGQQVTWGLVQQQTICTCSQNKARQWFKNLYPDVSIAFNKVIPIADDDCQHGHYMYIHKQRGNHQEGSNCGDVTPQEPTADPNKDGSLYFGGVVYSYSLVCQQDQITGYNTLYLKCTDGQCKTGQHPACDSQAIPTSGWYTDMQMSSRLNSTSDGVLLQGPSAYYYQASYNSSFCEKPDQCQIDNKKIGESVPWLVDSDNPFQLPQCCSSYKYTYTRSYQKVQKDGEAVMQIKGQWNSTKGQLDCNCQQSIDTKDCAMSHTLTVCLSTPTIQEDREAPQFPQGVSIPRLFSRYQRQYNVQAGQNDCVNVTLSDFQQTSAQVACKDDSYNYCQGTCKGQWCTGAADNREPPMDRDSNNNKINRIITFKYTETYSTGQQNCIAGKWEAGTQVVCGQPGGSWDNMDPATSHVYTLNMSVSAGKLCPSLPVDQPWPQRPKQKWTLKRTYKIEDDHIVPQDNWSGPQLYTGDTDDAGWDTMQCAQSHTYIAYTQLCSGKPSAPAYSPDPGEVGLTYTRKYIWDSSNNQATWQNRDNQAANWEVGGIVCTDELGKWSSGQCGTYVYKTFGTTKPSVAPQKCPSAPTPKFLVTLQYKEDGSRQCSWQFTDWSCNLDQQSHYQNDQCNSQNKYTYIYIGGPLSDCGDIPAPKGLPAKKWTCKFSYNDLTANDGSHYIGTEFSSWEAGQITCNKDDAGWDNNQCAMQHTYTAYTSAYSDQPPSYPVQDLPFPAPQFRVTTTVSFPDDKPYQCSGITGELTCSTGDSGWSSKDCTTSSVTYISYASSYNPNSSSCPVPPSIPGFLYKGTVTPIQKPTVCRSKQNNGCGYGKGKVSYTYERRACQKPSSSQNTCTGTVYRLMSVRNDQAMAQQRQILTLVPANVVNCAVKITTNWTWDDNCCMWKEPQTTAQRVEALGNNGCNESSCWRFITVNPSVTDLSPYETPVGPPASRTDCKTCTGSSTGGSTQEQNKPLSGTIDCTGWYFVTCSKTACNDPPLCQASFTPAVPMKQSGSTWSGTKQMKLKKGSHWRISHDHTPACCCNTVSISIVWSRSDCSQKSKQAAPYNYAADALADLQIMQLPEVYQKAEQLVIGD